MSFEEEFDRIIRQKMEGNKVPFNEGDWQKASNLIEKDRLSSSTLTSSKRFYKIAAVSFVITALTTISFLVVKEPPISKELVSETKVTKRDIQQKGVRRSATNNAKGRDEAKNADNPDLLNSGGYNRGTYKVSESKKESNSFQSNKRDNVKNASAVAQNATTASSETPPALNNESLQEAVASGVLIDDQTKDEKTELGIKNNSDDSSIEEIVNHTTIEQLDQQPIDFAYTSKEPELMPQYKFNMQLRDEDYYKKNAPGLSHFLLIEGGINYHMGWSDINGTDGKGLNWYGGLSYGYNFSKHVGLSLGLQAYTIGNIQTPFYNSSQKVYSFGSAQTQTVLTCNSLIYTAVPIKVLYTTTDNWRFAFGVNAGIVVASKNTMQTVQLSDGVAVASETKNDNGLYTGVNAYSFLMCASVSKEITKRVEFQAEFNYGLSDLFDNSASNTNKQSGNSIRLGLNYRLFTR